MISTAIFSAGHIDDSRRYSSRQ